MASPAENRRRVAQARSGPTKGTGSNPRLDQVRAKGNRAFVRKDKLRPVRQ